jgi:hypothetical protein
VTATVLLDAGPLGLVTNTNPRNPEAVQCAQWLQSLLSSGIRVCIPEVSDYEVRRSLIKIDSKNSINKLDQLNSVLDYQPITTLAMHQAAEFWARARKQGNPTADDKALDGDMVLVGQASEILQKGDNVIIATTNVKHIELFMDARQWNDITAADLA